MPQSITLYNHVAKLVLNKELNFSTLKAELLSGSASFNATHTTKSQVDNAGAYEVSGFGWPAGGPTLANVTVSIVTTNDAMLDCDDVSVNMSGGSLIAPYCLFYDATTNKPIAFVDFGASLQASDGTPFIIRIPAGGLLSNQY